MGTGGLSPAVKRPGREADHSPPASAKVKKTWIYTSTPPYVFMAYCLISLAQNNFTLFTFLLKQQTGVYVLLNSENMGLGTH
jgi:hypothetical protein